MTPASIEEAILHTLLYADVFDCPLTLAEIQRYLIGPSLPAEAVQTALETSPWLTARVTRVNGYFAVRGRAEIGHLRDERRRHSAALWPAARRWGARMGALPFVRMVAVTGALAVDNSPPGDDIDYLLVTAPGRVWLARAFAVALVRLARLRGVELCPNYVLSQSALEQRQRDLYSAHDLAQMVPLVGHQVYAEMRRANRWAEGYLPHAHPAPLPQPDLAPRGWVRLAQRLLEWPLSGWLGHALEAWERRRKLRKFASAARAAGDAAQLDADHVKGHFNDNRGLALRRFEERVARLVENAG